MATPDIVIDKKTETRNKSDLPPKFNVVALNDDYTPMDFVVMMLKTVFNKTHEDAVQTMLAVHKSGRGVCGTYSRDIAETKIANAEEMARRNMHPLKLTLEQA